MEEAIKAYWRGVLSANWQDEQGIQNFEDVAQVVAVERGMSIEEARETIRPQMEQFIVTYRDNPGAQPFVSSHWIIEAMSAEAAIEQVANRFWYSDKEAVKTWLMAYPIQNRGKT